jgi:hypothetical protein
LAVEMLNQKRKLFLNYMLLNNAPAKAGGFLND